MNKKLTKAKSDVEPLFKYIGGKSWLFQELNIALGDVLQKNVANGVKIKSYFEPFCGGLGAFLSLANQLKSEKIKNITLNDINIGIISLYSLVLHDREKLIIEYRKIENKYNKLILKIDDQKLILIKKMANSKEQKEVIKKELNDAMNFYMEKRAEYNETHKLVRGNNINFNNINSDVAGQSYIKLASLLLFLQKHSFNGIYRENLKGEHNTPFNWSLGVTKTDSVIDRIEHLYQLFHKFNVQFTNIDYKKINYKLKNTVYYLDPPYINEEIKENKYNKTSFGVVEQKELIVLINESMNFIYSNHKNINLIKEFTGDIKIKTVTRKNNITSKSSNRSADILEMLVIKSTPKLLNF